LAQARQTDEREDMFEQFDPRTHSRIVRETNGVARMLSHPGYHLVSRASTPQHAAKAYLRHYGHLLGLRQQHLKNMASPVAHQLTDAGVEYRFLAEKRQSDIITVAYHQTCLGLPVWEAGFSVTMKHEPFRVIGSRSTRHPELSVKPSRAAEQSQMLHSETLAESLGLAGSARCGAPLHITDQRLMIYQHDAERLKHTTAPPKRLAALQSGAPTLPLARVHKSIRDGRHYIVRAVYFSFDLPPVRPLHWVALIEAETSSVLLLRPFVDNIVGWVFKADPATLGGPPADAGNAALNPLRSAVRLPGLAAPVKGAQALRGSRVVVADVVTPQVAPPTIPAGKNFRFDARSNNFAAVNAYYNCDRVFRLVEDLGFPLADYFPGTRFPSPVDHRGHFDKNFPHGDEINAHCAGNASGTGIGYTTFSLADVRNLKQPIGIACDWRIVLHELLGHGILYNHIGAPRFKFAHSAGDSFAAIINDPDNKARDRYDTFPWLTGIAPAARRRHDRPVAKGWGWGGDIARHPFDNEKDPGGYRNEQILSSTMFRFYRAIGGDSNNVAARRFAARMTCRLMLAGIHTFTPATSPMNAFHFASALMEADVADWPAEGISGGAYHKVIRWAFEKQGLYQPAGIPRPNNKEGAPPLVDVYIEDGRHGEYAFQSNYWNCQAIWNRRRNDGGTSHEQPIAGVTNYAYVKIKNRGSQKAVKVVVRAFHAGPAAKRIYPRDYQAMKLAKLAVTKVPPSSSAEIVVGPFAWVPSGAGRSYMLMVASAAGDPSNVDNFAVRDSMPDWRLVPNDNNVGQRRVSVVKQTRRERARG
jgi:zinc metalloprotease ZmpB